MLRPRKTILFLIAVILIIAGVGFTARPVEATYNTNVKCHDCIHCPNPPRPAWCQHYSKDACEYVQVHHRKSGHFDYSKDCSYYVRDYQSLPRYCDYSKDYSYYGKDYHKPSGHCDYSKEYYYCGKDYQCPPVRSQYKTYSNTHTRYWYVRNGVWTLNP